MTPMIFDRSYRGRLARRRRVISADDQLILIARLRNYSGLIKKIGEGGMGGTNLKAHSPSPVNAESVIRLHNYETITHVG
jgi:hypothetical protein